MQHTANAFNDTSTAACTVLLLLPSTRALIGATYC
jgi:hypothetical protein